MSTSKSTVTVTSGWHPGFARLSWLPVEHACGHFELRFMRWYSQDDADRGYASAGSVCSTCAPQGRSVVTNYPDLATAQAVALEKNSEAR